MNHEFQTESWIDQPSNVMYILHVIIFVERFTRQHPSPLIRPVRVSSKTAKPSNLRVDIILKVSRKAIEIGHAWMASRVESRRSFSVKADDPEKDQSRRSRSKADDPWVKADDPSKSRRSFVKADDLLGSKQTIFVSKQTIQGESGRS